jgi:four helix bundle protein
LRFRGAPVPGSGSRVEGSGSGFESSGFFGAEQYADSATAPKHERRFFNLVSELFCFSFAFEQVRDGMRRASNGAMAGVRDHTELDAWKLSETVQKEVERITSSPSFNRYPRLKDQMQRASESPCPNIAEGFSRYYPREIARFVRMATGSLSELLDHLRLATRRRLVSEADARNLESFIKRARGAATKWLRYLESGLRLRGPGGQMRPRI